MNAFIRSVLSDTKRMLRLAAMMPSPACCLRRIAETPGRNRRKTNRAGIAVMVVGVIGGMLLDAIRFPAAAQAQAAADQGDFVCDAEWYPQQFVQWIRVSIDSTFRAYHIDANGLYSISLTLAVFVCLMVKAFTLGKVTAKQESRDRRWHE
jgi:hypothetical protein